MREEFVVGDWQLLALEAWQWKEMGAPIGLSAAIRQICLDALTEDGTSSTSNTRISSDLNRNYQTSLLTSDSLSASASRKHSSNNASSAHHPRDLKHDREHNLFPEDDDDKHENLLRSLPPQSIWQILTAFRGYSTANAFVTKDAFMRGILHAKSGDDLKAHTMFVMQLDVVVAALLTGAAVELWDVFPQDLVTDDSPEDGSPYVPRVIAFLFHIFSCVTVILQLFNCFSCVGSLFVAAAVSPANFPKYIHQVHRVICSFFFLTEFGTLLFVTNVGVLFAAMTWANSTDPLVQILVGILLPALIVIPLTYFVVSVMGYNLQVAFHGLLLSNTLDITNKTVSDVDTTGNGNIAKHVEDNLCKSFHRHSVKDVDEAMDLYQMANQQQHSQHNKSFHHHSVQDVDEAVALCQMANQTQHNNHHNSSNVKLSVPTDRKHLTGQEYTIPKFQPPNTTETDKPLWFNSSRMIPTSSRMLPT
jgi:hypothetical protein